MMLLMLISRMRHQQQKKRHRVAFTPEEDNWLRHLVQIHGEDNWAAVSSQMIDRSPRQCRERYRSYLQPSLKNGPWTNEEDNLLIHLVSIFHNRWVFIASHFEGRSDSNVKNRWYTHLQPMAQNKQEDSLESEDFDEPDEFDGAPMFPVLDA